MKNILTIFFISLCTVVNAQNKTLIKGRVENICKPGMKVTVYVRNSSRIDTLASTTINDDHTYQLLVPYEYEHEATVDCEMWQTVQVWLCNEPLEINFRGGKPDEEFKNEPFYVDQRGGSNAEVMNLINYEYYRNFSLQLENSATVWNSEIDKTEHKRFVSSRLNSVVQNSSQQMMEYIALHFSTRPSVMAALDRLVDEKYIPFKDSIMNVLSKSSSKGRKVINAYNKRKSFAQQQRERVKTGKPAVDFKFVDQNGTKHSLSEFTGKGVLVVDFWASWCTPCRREIPTLKAVYDEFKDKGVNILSVSLDSNSESWIKAISEEGMTWPQMITTDTGREIMELYQFSSIPKIMIIDANGNIFRDSARGQAIKIGVEKALNIK